MMDEKPDPVDKRKQRTDLNPLQVVASVFAAGLGVQSSKNRERDFTRGRPAAYIIVGIIMTVLFILVLWLAVKIAMRMAGV